MANPQKPRPIYDILLRNRDRLVEFLASFQTERADDEQFNDEKAYLIKQIKDLRPPPGGPPAAAAAAAASAAAAPNITQT